MKHFQVALKLHAQGPRFFDDASDAYNALFECDIFKYPESKTEYERAESGPQPQTALDQTFVPDLDMATSDMDASTSSSLPQAFYLAYKNHGQFALDRIKDRLKTTNPDDPSSIYDDPSVIENARKALNDFAAALDRDPSDAELWRKTARVAAFLKSPRISRFCLEAAIELDDDPAVVDVEPPSLAEALAGEQLRKQLEVLSDDVALSHPIMKPFLEKKVPKLFRRYLDPIPFLPNSTSTLATPKPAADEHTSPERTVIDLPTASWAELGMNIVRFYADHGPVSDGLHLKLPPGGPDEDAAEQMEVDKQLRQGNQTDKSGADPKSNTPSGEPKATGRDGSRSENSKNQTAEAQSTAPDSRRQKERSLSFPSRKRSQSVAGLQGADEDENAENKRSKRTRRRDTAAEDAMDPATTLAAQLQPFQAADQNLFQTTKNILENLGVTDRATLDRIAEVLDTCASEERTAKVESTAAADLRETILSFKEDNAKILLNKKESPQPSLSTFLEHTKSGSQRVLEAAPFDEAAGLKAFVDRINAGWYSIQELAYEWIKAIAPSYVEFKWSDSMKTAVVQVISRLDEPIYYAIKHHLGCPFESAQAGEKSAREAGSVTEMLFELHLDVYDRITNPNSVVEVVTRTETKLRLGRWMRLASEVARGRFGGDLDELALRFLWAAVFFAAVTEDAARDHILACWNSLREDLTDASHDIALPNNVVMPEISVPAVNREISKLTTMDFFLGLFREEIADPIAIIDALEPVLNPGSVYVAGAPRSDPDEDRMEEEEGDEDGTEKDPSGRPITECAGQGLRDLWRFLKESSTDLRLFLWGRLGEAYTKIDYATKQFSCLLRSIEMVISDLEQHAYTSTPQDSRRNLFVTMLKSLDDLLIQALSLALNDNSVFDIIDDSHLKSTSSALAKLCCLLHTAAMVDDEIRIGMTQARAGGASFNSLLVKLREMQVRAWSLQYTILKVGIAQDKVMFPHPENDLADYLSAVHQVLGLRKCCKGSNKVFLKMMRVELLKQKNIENWEDYLGQVLYDLHGLKLGVGIWEVQDHGCPPEKLERKQAMALVDRITVLANRMSMKDLLKSDLKNTIDHMQQAIGSTKSTPQMIHNLRNFTEYLKKPIHPLRLYQALTGNVTLDAVTADTPESNLARHGWFFLLGMIALTKFKGVDLNRRQTPGATDDLRIGATFLRLQLQFTPERWDAWFRLAECFDYELDEAVLWSADKMNKDRGELVKFQRNSIHCYTLALSHSLSWDPDPEVAASALDEEEVLSELYHKFGMRLYSSSREPFAMEPFQHADQERFFIGGDSSGTYKKILHEQMGDYKVWKYAAELFRRAMTGKPKLWKNPYMLAKCLWKMYQAPADTLDEKDKAGRPTVQTVVRALEKTVEVVSMLPKPRHGQDPILEPHYKILSVIHKLVVRGDLAAQEGANILQRQPYAVQTGEPITISEGDDWEPYVIKSLRHLRDKDKSNWQHRLVIRHARILFENDNTGASSAQEDASTGGDGGRYVSAKAAFTVLREGMFTKTMVMNVWKCDAERPGRHHVYTERYVRLMVRLLAVMNDCTNMEALLRRIRKKGADFYHFNDLWQSCVMAYLKLLRHSYQIPTLEDDPFKGLTPDEFEVIAEAVNKWAASSEAQDQPELAAMKDVIELKKLNANLTKATPIDDLVSDCYSLIYLKISDHLPDPEPPTAEAEAEAEASRPQNSEGQPGNAAEAKPATTGEKDRDPGSVLGSLRAPSEQPERMEKQPSSTGDPAPRPRKVGIRKPDILRRAEQAIVRAAEGPPKNTAQNGTSNKSRPGSTSSGKRDTPAAEADDMDADGGGGGGDDGDGEDAGHDGDEDVDMKDGEDGGDDQAEAAEDGDASGLAAHNDEDDEEEEAGSNAASSVPGSVHDSADDESDLSDVPADYEDDVPASLLFPNLRRSVDVAPGSDAESETEDSDRESSAAASPASEIPEEMTPSAHEGEEQEEE